MRLIDSIPLPPSASRQRSCTLTGAGSDRLDVPGERLISAGVTIAQKGRMMRFSGLVLQIVAVLTVLLGVLAGIAELVSDTYATTGGAILIGSVVGGLLLFGIGGAMRALADIAADVRRSADANERAAAASARRVEALDRLAARRDGSTTSTQRDTAERMQALEPDAKLPQHKA